MSTQTHHDQPYSWGRGPSTYLSTRQVARLTIMRSTLEDRYALRNRHIGTRVRQAGAADVGASS